MRILLVDDSATMRQIQKNVLAKIGYADVVEASDGEEAIATLARSGPVDLILCDWNMPKMDGLTFLKHIRSSERTKATPFIMVTSENGKPKVLEAIKAGVSSYVIKPFTADGIKEKILKVAPA